MGGATRCCSHEGRREGREELAREEDREEKRKDIKDEGRPSLTQKTRSKRQQLENKTLKTAPSGPALHLLALLRLGALLGVGRLGGKKLGLDGGEDTSLGDDDGSEQLVQLLVVSDGELEVSGDDTRLLVVSGGLQRQIERRSA